MVKPEHYVAHVAVPSQVDVEQMLVMRQRKLLLDKYVSTTQLEGADQTMDLLGQKHK